MQTSSRLRDGWGSELQVLWEDGGVLFCRGWRDAGDGNRTAVLAVVPAAEHSTPGHLERLAHEYGLKDELDSAWAARPLELVREHERTLLVLEDPGGWGERRGAAHRLRDRFAPAARAPGPRSARSHRRHAGLYGARADWSHEP